MAKGFFARVKMGGVGEPGRGGRKRGDEGVTRKSRGKGKHRRKEGV